LPHSKTFVPRAGTVLQALTLRAGGRALPSNPPSYARKHSHQRLMHLMAAGIRTSATTDWPPNAGIASSSDRTAPGRTSRFSAPDRSPAGTASYLGSPRESRARRASCDRQRQSRASAPPTGPAPRSNSSGSRGGVAYVHVALVVHHVAGDDQADRWNV